MHLHFNRYYATYLTKTRRCRRAIPNVRNVTWPRPRQMYSTVPYCMQMNTYGREAGPTLAGQLGKWAVGAGLGVAPPRMEKVLDSIVDTVGVTVLGLAQPDLDPVSALVPLLRSGVPFWDGTAASTAPGAAFLNATAGHLLDFDDTHYQIHGHPSTVVLPAVFAAAPAGASGASIVRGYLAGLGAMSAVAALYGPEHYSRGWHSTSTCGVVGAAVGSAVVRGQPAAAVANAISISISMTQGVRANFGTLMKPIHAGLAARAGVEASMLSEAGVTASPVALDGRYGGTVLFGERGSQSQLLSAEALQQVAAGAADDLGIKLYPCCRGSHLAIDAALDAAADLPKGTVIDRIELLVPWGTRTALLYDEPASGMEAKFSLPYAVATALVRGTPRMEHFTDAAVREPAVRMLMDTIDITEDTARGDLSATMDGRYADLVLFLRGGGLRRVRVENARGSAERPLTPAEVDEKFMSTAGSVLHVDKACELLARLRQLVHLPSVDGLFRN